MHVKMFFRIMHVALSLFPIFTQLVLAAKEKDIFRQAIFELKDINYAAIAGSKLSKLDFRKVPKNEFCANAKIIFSSTGSYKWGDDQLFNFGVLVLALCGKQRSSVAVEAISQTYKSVPYESKLKAASFIESSKPPGMTGDFSLIVEVLRRNGTFLIAQEASNGGGAQPEILLDNALQKLDFDAAFKQTRQIKILLFGNHWMARSEDFFIKLNILALSLGKNMEVRLKEIKEFFQEDMLSFSNPKAVVLTSVLGSKDQLVAGFKTLLSSYLKELSATVPQIYNLCVRQIDNELELIEVSKWLLEAILSDVNILPLKIMAVHDALIWAHAQSFKSNEVWRKRAIIEGFVKPFGIVSFKDATKYRNDVDIDSLLTVDANPAEEDVFKRIKVDFWFSDDILQTYLADMRETSYDSLRKRSFARYSVFNFISKSIFTANLEPLNVYWEASKKKAGGTPYAELTQSMALLRFLLTSNSMDNDLWLLRIFHGRQPKCSSSIFEALKKAWTFDAKLVNIVLHYFCGHEEFGKLASSFISTAGDDLNGSKIFVHVLQNLILASQKEMVVVTSLKDGADLFNVPYLQSFMNLELNEEPDLEISFEDLIEAYPKSFFVVLYAMKNVYFGGPALSSDVIDHCAALLTNLNDQHYRTFDSEVSFSVKTLVSMAPHLAPILFESLPMSIVHDSELINHVLKKDSLKEIVVKRLLKEKTRVNLLCSAVFESRIDWIDNPEALHLAWNANPSDSARFCLFLLKKHIPNLKSLEPAISYDAYEPSSTKVIKKKVIRKVIIEEPEAKQDETKDPVVEDAILDYEIKFYEDDYDWLSERDMKEISDSIIEGLTERKGTIKTLTDVSGVKYIRYFISGVPHRVFFQTDKNMIYVLSVGKRANCYESILMNQIKSRRIIML